MIPSFITQMDEETIVTCPICSEKRYAREWQHNTLYNIMIRDYELIIEKHSLWEQHANEGKAKFICPACESFVKKPEMIWEIKKEA